MNGQVQKKDHFCLQTLRADPVSNVDEHYATIACEFRIVCLGDLISNPSVPPMDKDDFVGQIWR